MKKSTKQDKKLEEVAEKAEHLNINDDVIELKKFHKKRQLENKVLKQLTEEIEILFQPKNSYTKNAS